MSRFDVESAATLYLDGVSASEIGRVFGVCTSTVMRALRRHNVVVRPFLEAVGVAHRRNPENRSRSGCPRRYACNQSFFDEVTPASAYVVGFIQADGTICPDRFSITTSVKDTEFLQMMAGVMGTNRPLLHVQHKLGSVVRLQINSRQMVQALMGYGIHSPRTETASIVPVLRHNPHYWRGVVDGDGCLHVDTRGNRILQLVGAAPLCEQFRDFVLSLGVTGKASVRTCSDSSRIRQVRVQGRDARMVCRVLYEGADVFLPRKMSIYEEFFRW